MRVSRTALWIAASVALVPSLCLVGLAMVGRALDGMNVAEGQLRSREEILEAQRRFMAMTPAQHLAVARARLDQLDADAPNSYVIERVDAHLQRIPASAPEAAAATALRARLDGQRARLDTLRREAFGRALAYLPRVASRAEPGQEGHSTRCAMFTAIRAGVGLGVFSPAPPFDEGFVLNVPECNEISLRRLVPIREPLRRMNFRRVQCGGDGPSLTVEEL